MTLNNTKGILMTVALSNCQNNPRGTAMVWPSTDNNFFPSTIMTCDRPTGGGGGGGGDHTVYCNGRVGAFLQYFSVIKLFFFKICSTGIIFIQSGLHNCTLYLPNSYSVSLRHEHFCKRIPAHYKYS